MYIVSRPIRVGDEIRRIGDLVPEAADWPPYVLRSHLSIGNIKEVLERVETRVEVQTVFVEPPAPVVAPVSQAPVDPPSQVPAKGKS